MKPYRIVLADDHVVIRQGMKQLIEDMPGLEVSGQASDGFELLDILQELQPDMVILDISMPNLNGIETIPEIRELYPRTKVLLLTMHSRREYLYRALSEGAHGYLLKEDSAKELFSAIDTIKNGGTYVTQRLAGKLTEDLLQTFQGNTLQHLELLTGREREILKLIAEGKSNRDISRQLFISIRTVETHRSNMMKKLNMKTGTDLIKYAIDKWLN